MSTHDNNKSKLLMIRCIINLYDYVIVKKQSIKHDLKFSLCILSAALSPSSFKKPLFYPPFMTKRHVGNVVVSN